MDGVHATCVNSNHSGPNCKSKLPVSGRTSPWKCCPAASPRLPEDRFAGHSRSSNHSVFDKQPICSLDEPGDWTWQSDDDGASSCRKTKWRTVGSVISVRRTCNISAGRDGSVLDSTESASPFTWFRCVLTSGLAPSASVKRAAWGAPTICQSDEHDDSRSQVCCMCNSTFLASHPPSPPTNREQSVTDEQEFFWLSGTFLSR